MNDIVVGIVAVAIGLFLCLRGHWALRLLLAAWGALIGLALGGAIIEQVSGGGFLGTFAGWALGLVLAVAFALIAYLYYAVSIVLAMVSMGFVLGGTLASALGASQTWILTLAGIAVGLCLAVLAIITNLPALLLVLLSAGAGASVTIGGLMLIFSSTTLDELTEGHVAASDHAFWYVGYVALFAVGVVVQLSSLAALRDTDVRAAWSAPR